MSPPTTPPTTGRGRFAPSPTGPLHFGSLVAALGSWLVARHAGGEWLVRIEDLDPPREAPGAADAQLRTLAGFGLVSDHPPVRQSERHPRYHDALDRLLVSGQAFRCHCSRGDLVGVDGIHRVCVDSARPQAAIRLRVADGETVGFEDCVRGRFEQNVARAVGDFVLRRADGLWAYQLAVVVDDAEQGIEHVVRGADLLDSTPRQILLQRALGLPTPRYTHLPLILDAQGRKLSKSLAALAVDGDDPLPALRLAWRALGQDRRALDWSGPIEQILRRAVRRFDPGRIPKQDVSFAALHNHPAANRA
ncbi:MAG: tRNA glutamyl-Q(34) synthetase GluQRS [Lysobacteraceae bacterium]|nr:MAG: tRNA glutamyl-Q(34) synthetase GluQRS [Xanthomonadaceae bacterium]